MYGSRYFGPLYWPDSYFGHIGAPFELGQPAGGGGSSATAGAGYFPPDYWAPAYWSPSFWIQAATAAAPAADLLDAIWAYADADSGLFAAFGRPGWLWIGKGARGTPLPYAVLFEVASVQIPTTGDIYYENVSVQFNVFAASEPAAKRLGHLILDLFAPRHDQTPMRFAGGEDLTRWLGDGNILERDPARGAGGSDVFVQRINYTWRLGRSYAPD